MTLILELPKDLESELAAEANRLNLPLTEYALQVLARGQPTSVQNGADLVSYWRREGLIGTRTDITDPSAHARALREAAQRRERT